MEIVSFFHYRKFTYAFSCRWGIGTSRRSNWKDFQKSFQGSSIRFLKLEGRNLVGDFKNLLSSLRWLSWCHCPSNLQSINQSMYMEFSHPQAFGQQYSTKLEWMGHVWYGFISRGYVCRHLLCHTSINSNCFVGKSWFECYTFYEMPSLNNSQLLDMLEFEDTSFWRTLSKVITNR